jgi:hypothetical protein
VSKDMVSGRIFKPKWDGVSGVGDNWLFDGECNRGLESVTGGW